MNHLRAISIVCAVAGCCLTTAEAAAQEIQTPSAPDTQTWEINARDQDIQQFITQVSQITGRPFVIDPRMKGSVAVVSKTEFDPDSVYELLLSVLRVHGFGAYSIGEVVHVVQNPTLVKRTGGGGETVSRRRVRPSSRRLSRPGTSPSRNSSRSFGRSCRSTDTPRRLRSPTA